VGVLEKASTTGAFAWAKVKLEEQATPLSAVAVAAR
jgi:hypothetical protein